MVESVHNGDETALNEIELVCNDGNVKKIRGAKGFWGTWGTEQTCPDEQPIVGFQIKQESAQGHRADDTGANGVQMICLDGTVLSAGNDAPWGEWSEKHFCPENTAVCGLRVQIEAQQGSEGDDTALNNVDFKCCPPADPFFFY